MCHAKKNEIARILKYTSIVGDLSGEPCSIQQLKQFSPNKKASPVLAGDFSLFHKVKTALDRHNIPEIFNCLCQTIR